MTETLEVVNPATEQRIASLPLAGEVQASSISGVIRLRNSGSP